MHTSIDDLDLITTPHPTPNLWEAILYHTLTFAAISTPFLAMLLMQ